MRIGPFKLISCLSGYLLKNLGSVGRLKKENRNMNIIIKGCDVIHNAYKLPSPKVVTPIAFYNRPPLRYHSSPINHHTGPRITASGSHLSFLSVSLRHMLETVYLFSNYPKIFICKLKYHNIPKLIVPFLAIVAMPCTRYIMHKSVSLIPYLQGGKGSGELGQNPCVCAEQGRSQDFRKVGGKIARKACEKF